MMSDLPVKHWITPAIPQTAKSTSRIPRAEDALNSPLIAVLNRVPAADAFDLAEALLDAGIDRINLPLNDADTLANISAMARACGNRAVIGACAVGTQADITRASNAGAQLVLMSRAETAMIAHARRLGLESCPGTVSADEAVRAAKAGASAVQLPQAGALGPERAAAIASGLPKGLPLYAFGGIRPDSFKDWLAMGVTRLGIGGMLYKSGDRPQLVNLRARILMMAMRDAQGQLAAG